MFRVILDVDMYVVSLVFYNIAEGWLRAILRALTERRHFVGFRYGRGDDSLDFCEGRGVVRVDMLIRRICRDFQTAIANRQTFISAQLSIYCILATSHSSNTVG